MMRNKCKISGDTLSILEYGTERQSCPGAKGIYRITSDGNSFTVTLIDRRCEGRARTYKQTMDAGEEIGSNIDIFK